MTLLVRARLVARTMMLVSILAVSANARALRGQTQSSRPDSAALYKEAQQLSSRADTLARGSVSDQQKAVILLRQAAESYSKGGAPRDHATTLNRIGVIHSQSGRQDSALAYHRQALAISRVVRDRRGEAQTLNRIGRAFREISQQDSAMEYFRSALPMARSVGDRTGEAETLSDIGGVFIRLGQPDSAFTYFGLALPIDRAEGNRSAEALTLLRIGVFFTFVGQPDSALTHYRRALVIRREIGDRRGEATTLNNIGYVFAATGQPDSGVAYYRHALPIHRAVGDREGEARALHNIGDVFADISQPDSSLTYYHRALPIRRAIGDRHGEATTLNTVGVVFANFGQADSALAYFRQALQMRRAIGNRSAEGGTLTNMGAIFLESGRPDSAIAYFREALPILHAVREPTGEARTLHRIADVFADTGAPDSALAYYRRALPIQRAIGDRVGEAWAVNSIGQVFAALRRPDSALASYRQVLPIWQAVGNRTGTATTLRNVGKTYRDIGRLDSALVHFDRATALLSAISQSAGSDFNQLSYNETTTEIYDLWTLTWLALAPHGAAGSGTRPHFDSASAAYGALAAAERGRARALLDLMRDTTAHVEAGADFPAEGARLAATLRRSNSAGLIYISTGDTLLTWVLSSSGKVNVFRRAIARDTLAAAVGAFRDDLGGQSGSARLALRGAGLEGANRASGKGASSAGSAWRRGADELVTILMPPEVLRLLKAEKEVVIVPQSTLALVPFAALPIGPAGEPFGAKLAIRYASSLATLGQVEARPALTTGTSRGASLRQALVVGNPKMPEVTVSSGSRDRLSPLPGAEAESRGIAARLGTQALTGAAATETEVVRRLPQASLVHLATHGFAYSAEAKARNSFVALSPDSTHDGLLTVGKILDDPELKLTADLVVLSACQTGLGNLRQAEGTVGLQRAFLAKGARSLLVSLWNVSDAATQKLMTGFYQHWLRDPDHPSKAEALRRSQEEVRKTPGFEHPRFWAAFQLAGAR